MSFFDSIFGGESTKGIKFTQADNERRQEFVEEQTQQARDDIFGIYPRGEAAMRQGYRSAIDQARRTPIAQSNALNSGSLRAQQSLLGGMNEYRRSILGMPSEMDPRNYYNNRLGLRPESIGGNAFNVFTGGETPTFLSTRNRYFDIGNPDGYSPANQTPPQPADQPFTSGAQSAVMPGMATFLGGAPNGWQPGQPLVQWPWSN